MAKVYRVQVEILLTADEKALLEHYVKENNRRYKKRGATRNWWTLEKLLQCLLSDITYQAVKYRVSGLSGRNCREPVPALFTNSHSGGALMFSVFATGKRSFLFVYQKNKIKGYQQTLAAGWSLWISCCLWNR